MNEQVPAGPARRVARALRAVVVPPAGSGRLAGSALADAVGSGMFMSGAVIFFSRRLGLDTVAIGGGLAVAGIVALLVVTPLGVLADRFGYQRSLLVAHLARAAIYPLYLVVNGPIGFAAVITLLTVGDRLAAPVFQAVVGTAVGERQRAETMGYVRALRNAGFSLGALLTTAALSIGTPLAYDAVPVGNAVSFAVAGVLLSRIPNVRAPRRPAGGPRVRGVRPRYLALAGLNVVMLLHDTILQVALPLFVIERTSVPAAALPLMFVLNTVLVVVLQRRLSGSAATVPDAARSEQTAGYLLAGACACLAVAALLPTLGAVAALVAGVVLLTLGESLQVAGAWELSHGHAPETDRGTYLAVFSIGIGVQRSAGPAVVSLFAVLGAFTWVPIGAAFVLAGTAIRRFAARPWPEPAPRGIEDPAGGRTVG